MAMRAGSDETEATDTVVREVAHHDGKPAGDVEVAREKKMIKLCPVFRRNHVSAANSDRRIRPDAVGPRVTDSS